MTTIKFTFTAALALLLAGCASTPAPDLDAMALQVIKSSFRDQGIATVDRLNQDLGQRACSSPTAPPDAVAAQIIAQAEATMKWPTGGQYLGDWREGEKLAQNGRGMTWTDPSAATSANGGNCYNCHQIDKAEISYGTIGPSLWNYGKLRGVTDPSASATAPIVQYTWGKLWNSNDLHLMRKIADLLYVGHADYVAAKQRARQSSALPAATEQQA